MLGACIVLWDIQNVVVPQGQSVESIVNLIRSTILKPYNLEETSIYFVCDINKLPPNFGQSLINLDINIAEAYSEIKDSAEIKIHVLDLLRNFVKLLNEDCTIIILSGDGDYYDISSELKKLDDVSIHLVGLTKSYSRELYKISDCVFMLDNGVLKPIKSPDLPSYFISVKNYTLTGDINYY